MRPEASEGWERDSDTLYLHSSGVRIERRAYRYKEGWFLIPVDLDQAVLEFSPDEDGLAHAFAAFSRACSEPRGSPLTRKVEEAREAARKDANEDKAADDEEEDEEDL